MHSRILTILICFVCAGLAHGVYVGLASSRYDKKIREEYGSQEDLAKIERYFYSSAHAPLVITGSSLADLISPDDFRVPADNLAVAGNDLGVLDLLSEQTDLPPIILIEATMILGMQEGSLATEAKAFQKRLLKQCQTRFRPTVMLLTELSNGFDAALSALDVIEGAGRKAGDASPSSAQAALAEPRIRHMIEAHQRSLSHADLDSRVAQIKQRADQFIKSGSDVILLSMPIDTRLAATPFYDSIRREMSAAFPADRYRWIAPRPAVCETSDGLHLTPPSARETAKLIDQALAAGGLYQKHGLLGASGNKEK